MDDLKLKAVAYLESLAASHGGAFSAAIRHAAEQLSQAPFWGGTEDDSAPEPED